MKYKEGDVVRVYNGKDRGLGKVLKSYATMYDIEFLDRLETIDSSYIQRPEPEEILKFLLLLHNVRDTKLLKDLRHLINQVEGGVYSYYA